MVSAKSVQGWSGGVRIWGGVQGWRGGVRIWGGS